MRFDIYTLWKFQGLRLGIPSIHSLLVVLAWTRDVHMTPGNLIQTRASVETNRNGGILYWLMSEFSSFDAVYSAIKKSRFLCCLQESPRHTAALRYSPSSIIHKVCSATRNWAAHVRSTQKDCETEIRESRFRAQPSSDSASSEESVCWRQCYEFARSDCLRRSMDYTRWRSWLTIRRHMLLIFQSSLCAFPSHRMRFVRMMMSS